MTKQASIASLFGHLTWRLEAYTTCGRRGDLDGRDVHDGHDGPCAALPDGRDAHGDGQRDVHGGRDAPASKRCDEGESRGDPGAHDGPGTSLPVSRDAHDARKLSLPADAWQAQRLRRFR